MASYNEFFEHAMDKSGKDYLTADSVAYLSALASLKVFKVSGIPSDDFQRLVYSNKKYPPQGVYQESMPDEDYANYKGIYIARGKCYIKKGTLIRDVKWNCVVVKDGKSVYDYAFDNPIYPIMLVEKCNFKNLYKYLKDYKFDLIGWFYTLSRG